MAHRGGGSGWTGSVSGTMSEIYVATVDLAEAEEMARDALEYALSSGDAPLTSMRYVVLAWILLLRGRLDEDEPLLAEARRSLAGYQSHSFSWPSARSSPMPRWPGAMSNEALAHLSRARRRGAPSTTSSRADL